jgi:endonuclease/exonuclease/phosphatase family metal-dependent hydrolase
MSNWFRFAVVLLIGCLLLSPVFARQSAPEKAAPVPSAAPAQPAADRSVIRFGELAPRPRVPGTIRIATYNVSNLFDSDPVTRVHSEGDPAPIKPKQEREAIAKAIRAVDADIIALEEVENLEVLKKFRDTYLSELGYEHLALVESEDPRGIDNAFLSRFPIVATVDYNDRKLGGTHPAREGNRPNPLAGQELKFRRTPLRIDVKVPGSAFGAGDADAFNLTLVAVHHKSGRGSDYWRIAESKGVVDIVREFEKNHPGAPLLVLGDLNSQSSEPGGKIYLQSGLIDSFAGRPPADPRNISHESGRRIDFIFLNEAANASFVPDSEFILGTPARPAGADWRNTPAPPGYGSDHYPVAIDLKPARVAAGQKAVDPNPNNP